MRRSLAWLPSALHREAIENVASLLYPWNGAPCMPSVLPPRPAAELILARWMGTTGKSKKKSLKWLNSAANWEAVQPYLPPRPEEEVAKIKVVRNAPIVETCVEPIPQVPVPTQYLKVGVITAPYQLQLEKKFAVIAIQGTQFKVTTDDIIFVPKMPDLEINDVIALNQVLLLGSQQSTLIGRPYLPDACVLAAVEEQFEDGLVHTFRLRRRHRDMRYRESRAMLTTLRILQIQGIDVPEKDQVNNELPVKLYRLLPVWKIPSQPSATSEISD